MNRPSIDSPGVRSLAETHADGIQLFATEPPKEARGCLLQIHPAAVHSEMIRLTKRRTLIGRDLSADVPLEDTAVSRTHAAIESDDRSYYVVDVGSRNGTFVDDELLVERRLLRGGELIRCGSTILKFMASMDEEAQYHAVVHELMTRDPLTNAFNRSYLMALLEKLVPRCRSTNQDLSIVMIDIDHFKKVNDSHGHLVGDEILRGFCERLRSVLRPDDVLCRFGGEEFVVVAERVGLQGAVRIAERLRLTVSSLPFSSHLGLLRITCSLGVASLEHGAASLSVDQFLAEADQWLYHAKNVGRNCVQSAIDVDTRGLGSININDTNA